MNMDSLKELQRLIADFIDKREWANYHTPKNLAMSISIEAAEIMELFQWLTNIEAVEKTQYDKAFLDELADEIADVMIYCLSLSYRCNINVGKAIMRKIQKNEKRFPVNIVKGRLGPYIIPEERHNDKT